MLHPSIDIGGPSPSPSRGGGVQHNASGTAAWVCVTVPLQLWGSSSWFNITAARVASAVGYSLYRRCDGNAPCSNIHT